jgi:hypothetical protein
VEDRRTTAERFNNHNWVEVWQDDIWSFIGEAPARREGWRAVIGWGGVKLGVGWGAARGAVGWGGAG